MYTTTDDKIQMPVFTDVPVASACLGSCSVAIYWSKQTCTFAVSDSHVYAQQTASMHNWVHGNAVLMNRNC